MILKSIKIQLDGMVSVEKNDVSALIGQQQQQNPCCEDILANKDERGSGKLKKYANINDRQLRQNHFLDIYELLHIQGTEILSISRRSPFLPLQ